MLMHEVLALVRVSVAGNKFTPVDPANCPGYFALKLTFLTVHRVLGSPANTLTRQNATTTISISTGEVTSQAV